MTFLKPKNKYTIVTKNIILNNEKIKYTIRRHRKAIRLKIAMYAVPTWGSPVGDGAIRTRTVIKKIQKLKM